MNDGPLQSSPESQPQSAKDTNNRTLIQLFLVSVLSLYVELLVIRWMSGDIRAFSVFKTFPMVTCYIGLGAGCALSQKKSFGWAAPALLLMVVIFKAVEAIHGGYLTFPSFSIFDWQEFQDMGTAIWGYLALVMLVLPVILGGPFLVCLLVGTKIGELFDQCKPLPAYTVNVLGAIAGSVLFAGTSFWNLPPWALLVPVAILMTILAPGGRYVIARTLALVAAIAIAAWSPAEILPDAVTYWSPYQRIDVLPLSDNKNINIKGIKILANRHLFQNTMDLEPYFSKSKDVDKQYRIICEHYFWPSTLKRNGDVLVVGAGMGNDVAFALRAGATSVDAVEIDPLIVQLGKTNNPEHPYQSEKVHVYCDDARHFFNKCNKRYDVIEFAWLDTHSTGGQTSSMRLDNYVYTKESIQHALQLLKPNGIIVLSFCANRFIAERLAHTIADAAGYPPLIHVDSGSEQQGIITFVLGDPVRTGQLTPPDTKRVDVTSFSGVRILTDDWPFLYVSPVKFDVPYLLIVLEVALITVVFASRVLRGSGKDTANWQMFFLGSAFLLMELQSIAKLSLLYGSTWITACVVIIGVLLLILCANLVVMRFAGSLNSRKAKIGLYAALLISIGISYACPVALGLNPQMNLIITAVSLAPIFAAGIIFASAFSRLRHPATALAYNLFGAVLGAMLEYLSNYTGINALVLIAALLYILSMFFALKSESSST